MLGGPKGVVRAGGPTLQRAQAFVLFHFFFVSWGNLKMRVVHNFHFVLLCARNINELAYRTGCPRSLSFFCRQCKSMYFLSGMKSEKVRLNKRGVGMGKKMCTYIVLLDSFYL